MARLYIFLTPLGTRGTGVLKKNSGSGPAEPAQPSEPAERYANMGVRSAAYQKTLILEGFNVNWNGLG